MYVAIAITVTVSLACAAYAIRDFSGNEARRMDGLQELPESRWYSVIAWAGVVCIVLTLLLAGAIIWEWLR